MEERRRAFIRRINRLTSEMDALYHQSSLRLGITDSVSVVLYAIYEAGGACPIGDICRQWGVRKQTVNSALRRLEEEGVLRLEQHTGRAKRAVLTDRGRDYVQQTAARLYEAEVRAFDTWPEEDVETYIRLMERYAACFRRQVEAL